MHKDLRGAGDLFAIFFTFLVRVFMGKMNAIKLYPH